MTAKNSILLMVKQSPGITYNSLLGKIASDFGSTNSARASLSRTLKDAVSFGLLKKTDNSYFITDKGNSTISFEMKNKLLMKLNALLSAQKKINELDSIVEQFHTMIERSKIDPDLLKTARSSATFFISDAVELNSEVNSRLKHLSYLSRILSKQIDSLKQLNFNDSVVFSKEKKSAQKLVLFFSSLDLTDFFVECPESVFQKFSQNFSLKTKKPPFSLKKELLPDFLSIAFSLKLAPRERIRVYFSSVRLKISPDSAVVSGPFNEIKTLKEK
ncbi:MAG: hypothetical protein ABIJ74_04015 [archaeon]